MKKMFPLFVLFTMTAANAFAQSAIVPVGGDAQSNSGSVSYTVGQIAVQSAPTLTAPLPCWKACSNPTKS